MIENISALLRLNDGMEMPGFGFGCYKASGPELALAVREAVACGYRYIDTAAYYNNEDTVGEALRQSGQPRETLFVLSKIWPTDFAEPVRALEQSLKLLGLDYLDGCLLHWPGLDDARRLRAFEQLLRQKEQGKIRVLGVSNFLAEHLSEMRDTFGFWPALNQIEVHPLFSQAGLCRFCAQAASRSFPGAVGPGTGPWSSRCAGTGRHAQQNTGSDTAALTSGKRPFAHSQIRPSGTDQGKQRGF